MSKLAISGCDGIGKTQQVRLTELGTSMVTHRLKRLVEYGDRWPALSETETHNWWFGQVGFDTLSSIIIEALNDRNANCASNKINIFDRGTIMFKAVLAATFATRELGTIEDGYIHVDNSFAHLLQYNPNEFEFLLVPDKIYQDSIKTLVRIADTRDNKYTTEQVTRYEVYQKYLEEAIEHYYAGMPMVQKITVNSCLLDIQNEIRKRTNCMFSTNLPMVCESFERGIGLGGLSESGKSCFGDTLSMEFGFYRLKLRYFEDALIRNRQTVNSSNMGFELASFLNCHPHISRVSVESIHDPILPSYLKLLFGERFKIVFLDTPEKLRIGRTAAKTGMSIDEAKNQVIAKDRIKRSRGAHRVKTIADVVIDNSADGLRNNIQEFIQHHGL